MSAVENFVNILHRLVTDYAGAEFDTTYGDSQLIIAWRKPLPNGATREVWLECDTMPIPQMFSISASTEGMNIWPNIWDIPPLTVDISTWDGTFPAEFVAYMDEHFRKEEVNGSN